MIVSTLMLQFIYNIAFLIYIEQQFKQLNSQVDLINFNPDTEEAKIFFGLAAGSLALLQSFVNPKQLSYFARVAMALTILCLGYIMFEIGFKIFYYNNMVS